MISFDRYRAKILEAARESAPVLMRLHPEFFDGTQLRFLFAPRPDEPPRLRLRKRLTRVALGDLPVAVLERWARATDGRPALFVPAVYHALFAGWFRTGFDAGPSGERIVSYG